MRPASLLGLAVVVLTLPCTTAGMAPRFSWDTLANMTFFHACNESGPFSPTALETIVKFPFVTIEKGQGFNDGTGRGVEPKIVEQLAAIKKIRPEICTVAYFNEVLDWYFYDMAKEFANRPEWWLRRSNDSKPFLTKGDKHFNPPEQGMLVFDHSKQAVRNFWISACVNATKSGVVDGCFSDSSEVASHKTATALNASSNAAFEAGKVQTSAALTTFFGGTGGQPFTPASSGVLIAKKPNQTGINAFQIEFFDNSEAAILELMAGVDQGYLVQAHVGISNVVNTCGCKCMNDTVAAFLVGAGEYSYYGSGSWIAAGLDDVEMRWCADLFERPLGAPVTKAVRGTDGVYRRSFASGTTVAFDTATRKGTIHWAA